jgi:hypothetical protein
MYMWYPAGFKGIALKTPLLLDGLGQF